MSPKLVQFILGAIACTCLTVGFIILAEWCS